VGTGRAGEKYLPTCTEERESKKCEWEPFGTVDFEFNCPSCGQSLAVDQSERGATVKLSRLLAAIGRSFRGNQHSTAVAFMGRSHRRKQAATVAFASGSRRHLPQIDVGMGVIGIIAVVIAALALIGFLSEVRWRRYLRLWRQAEEYQRRACRRGY